MPEWTGSRFLDQFVDAGLAHDPSWTPDAERSRQLDRVVPIAALARLVSTWSGRLDAAHYTRQQRSNDKKIARRVYSRMLTAVTMWGGDLSMVNRYEQEHVDELRQQAATLDWATFWADHRVRLTACLRHVATNAAKNAYPKDGNRFCNTLANEYRSLDDVLGVLEPVLTDANEQS